MKKLFAIVMALMMAMSCLGAFAEEPAQQPATDTVLKLSVNQGAVQMLAGMMMPAIDETMAEALVSVLDKTYMEVIESGNVAYCMLNAEGAVLTDIMGQIDETGITYISELFPHYQLRIDFEDLQDLASRAQIGMEEMGEVTVPQIPAMPELTEEQLAALEASAAAYMEDINAFTEEVQAGMILSEDGTAATIPLTTHQLAGLGEKLLARLSADEALMPFLQMIVDQVNAQAAEDEQITLEALLAMIGQAVEGIKSEEDQTLGAVTMINGENAQTIEINAANMILLSLTPADNGMNGTLLIAVNGIADKDAQISGVREGSNTDDVVADFTFASDAAEDGSGKTTAAITVYVGGLSFVLDMNDEMIGVGTEEQTDSFVCALSNDLLGGELLRLESATTVAAPYEAIVPDGLTELRIAKADDEAIAAFAKDIVGYGMPSLLAKMVLMMPDEAAVIVNMLAEQDTDGYDYFVDGMESEEYWGGEQDEETSFLPDMTGAWTADGATLELNADQTFTMTWKDATYNGTWETSFGTVWLNTDDYSLGSSYEDDALVFNMGFEALRFTR